MTGTLRRKPARADRYSGRRDPDRVGRRHAPTCAPDPPGESPLITATDLELRAGSRILLSDATLRVQPGDRIGLVGRNGAGKTTTMRVLAGEGEPYGGTIRRAGAVGYLPQDPREGDLTVTRQGPGAVRARPRRDAPRDGEGADGDGRAGRRRAERAGRARVRPHRGALRRARRVRRRERRRPHLRPPRACPSGCSASRSPRSRAVSAAASSWPASCSPPRTAAAGARRAPPRCCSTSPPTTSTPTRSPGCARSSPPTSGGLVVISHDTELLAAVVNKVWFLDAIRGEVDVYNMDWPRYLRGAGHRREAPPPRARQRREEGRRRCTCRRRRWARRRPRPSRRRTWPRRADQHARRARPEQQAATRWRASASPTRRRAGARRSPPRGCPRRSARWRSSPASTWPSTAAPRSSCSGSTARARPRCCGCSRARRPRTPARCVAGHGLRTGYFAQEHDTLDMDAHRLGERPPRRAGRPRAAAAHPARLVPVHRRAARPARGHPLRRRAHPAGARRARVQLGQRAAARRADQQPRPGQPRSRCSTRCAGSRARSCSSRTTPAPSRRSTPERVIVLPDGTEDLWSADYLDLVQLA